MFESHRVGNEQCGGLYTHFKQADVLHLDAEREGDLQPQSKKGKKRITTGADDATAMDADEDADAGPTCLPLTAQVTYLCDKAQGREGCQRILSNARKIISCVRLGKEGAALTLGTGCDRHMCASSRLTHTWTCLHVHVPPHAVTLRAAMLVPLAT